MDAEALVAGVHDAKASVVLAATAASVATADVEDALEAVAEAVVPVAGVVRKG